MGNKFCKLNRTVYGLRQSNTKWNKRIDRYLLASFISSGFIKSRTDLYLHCKYSEEVRMYAVLPVHDILIMGNHKKEINKVKMKSSSNYRHYSN